MLAAGLLVALPAVAVVAGALAMTGPLVAWLGGLAAVVGGVKLAGAAWGLAARVLERPRGAAVVASTD